VVKQAIANSLKVIAKHPDQLNHAEEMPPQKNIMLVADGGRENHNKKIDEFISKLSGRKITKIRALKDIRFSNSPVEAVHRTIKGRYLRGHKFASVEAVSKFLRWAVMDYNTLRPHYKHRPRTPHEVYFNIPLWFDLRTRTKKTMKERVRKNKNGKCIQCKGFKSEKQCSSNKC
jgi:putative transposase